MSIRTVGAHFPQEVPARVALPTALTVLAPASIASTISPLVTASQRQTHTVGHRTGPDPTVHRSVGHPVSGWVGVVPFGRSRSKPSGVFSRPGAVPGVSATPYCHTSAPVTGSMATIRSR